MFTNDILLSMRSRPGLTSPHSKLERFLWLMTLHEASGGSKVPTKSKMGAILTRAWITTLKAVNNKKANHYCQGAEKLQLEPEPAPKDEDDSIGLPYERWPLRTSNGQLQTFWVLFQNEWKRLLSSTLAQSPLRLKGQSAQWRTTTRNRWSLTRSARPCLVRRLKACEEVLQSRQTCIST